MCCENKAFLRLLRKKLTKAIFQRRIKHSTNLDSSYDLLHFADYQTSAKRPILTKAFLLCTMQHQHASAQGQIEGYFRDSHTYPAWACCRQFVERLCQVDSRIVHHLTYRIVFFLPSKG